MPAQEFALFSDRFQSWLRVFVCGVCKCCHVSVGLTEFTSWLNWKRAMNYLLYSGISPLCQIQMGLCCSSCVWIEIAIRFPLMLRIMF